jgi:hypothetical protein
MSALVGELTRWNVLYDTYRAPEGRRSAAPGGGRSALFERSESAPKRRRRESVRRRSAAPGGGRSALFERSESAPKRRRRRIGL